MMPFSWSVIGMASKGSALCRFKTKYTWKTFYNIVKLKTGCDFAKKVMDSKRIIKKEKHAKIEYK